MSVINKEPFIKKLLASCSSEELSTLTTLINGGGNQTPIKRTANPIDTPEIPHISVSDKGIHLCSLTINYTNFLGYLVYTDLFCALISFTDAQVLKIFDLTEDKTRPNTIDEAINILELRSTLFEATGGGTGFEEYTIDIYVSDFDITNPSTPIINNQEKASVISALIDKVNNGMKLYSGVVDVPSYTWTDEDNNEHTEKIWLQGACGYWNNDSSFERRLILIGDTDYSLGFLKVIGGLDIVTVFFGCSLSNAEDRQIALMTTLATDPTKYIRFKFRVEK